MVWRALASGAKLILLDEPIANLTLGESARLLAIMRRPARSGTDLAIGDVLGLAGTSLGPTTVIDQSIGVKASGDWQIARDGQPLHFSSPSKPVRAGIGYVSGDRTRKGTLTSLPILDNLVAASRVARRRRFTSSREATTVRDALKWLSIKASSVDASGKIRCVCRKDGEYKSWLFQNEGKPQCVLSLLDCMPTAGWASIPHRAGHRASRHEIRIPRIWGGIALGSWSDKQGSRRSMEERRARQIRCLALLAGEGREQCRTRQVLGVVDILIVPHFQALNDCPKDEIGIYGMDKRRTSLSGTAEVSVGCRLFFWLETCRPM